MQGEDQSQTVPLEHVSSPEVEPDIKETLLRKREVTLERLKGIEAAISQLRGEFRQKIGELEAQKQPAQETLHHLEALLRIEGINLDDVQSVNKDEPVGRAQVTGTGLALDAAYRLLERAHRSMHYREIARELQQQHVLIAGKDPAATLLSGMARDARFRRAKKRGTYRLASPKGRTKKSTRGKTSRPLKLQ